MQFMVLIDVEPIELEKLRKLAQDNEISKGSINAYVTSLIRQELNVRYGNMDPNQMEIKL